MTINSLRKSIALTFLAPVALSACMSSGTADNVDPASKYRSSELQTMTFTASSGQKFQIKHTFSNSISRYGVEIEALSGAPLGLDESGDIRAQNGIRDYFNKNVCSEGFYAGIVSIRYAPHPDERANTYGANLFCTTKHQRNL